MNALSQNHLTFYTFEVYILLTATGDSLRSQRARSEEFPDKMTPKDWQRLEDTAKLRDRLAGLVEESD